jgi:tripartite-type tricarboxylate transporter receptor subunit TctC
VRHHSGESISVNLAAVTSAREKNSEIAFALLYGCLTAMPAHAQSWPTQPIKIVVGFPPGGMADALPRKMQDALAAALGQPVIVENKPGGAGSIAVLAVTKSKDNHTFGILTLQNAALPALDPSATYDVRKDLQGVALIATVPNILAVTQGMPVKTAAEFMAYAKENPGKVRLATAGNGTGAHFALETLKVGAGLDIVHVPYKGVQASYADVIAGHVDATIAPYASMRPHLQSGGRRPLAVSTAQRSPLVPDLPTLVEVTGVKDLLLTDWYAVFAPSTMPADIVAKMQRTLLDIMKTPIVTEFTTTSGLQLNPMGAKPTTDWIVAEYDRMVIVAKKTGIKME